MAPRPVYRRGNRRAKRLVVRVEGEIQPVPDLNIDETQGANDDPTGKNGQHDGSRLRQRSYFRNPLTPGTTIGKATHDAAHKSQGAAGTASQHR